MRAVFSLCVLLLPLWGCGEKPGRKEPETATPKQDRKARPLIEKTLPERPLAERQAACVALGGLGGNAARGRLVELLKENTLKPEVDGPVRLYAAVGLTLLNDAGAAPDLLLALSNINPDDNIAALASEERNEEYYTVDAQICDALLGMGLLRVEDDLVGQLRRRHRIRVLIDAHAVLRRRTEKDLPFRYNGSYGDRNKDADRWQAWLTKTRGERAKQRPFDATNAVFRRRFQEVIDDLGTEVMNNLLIARKVVLRVGEYAVPFLLASLRSDNETAQREGALMLGRIGSGKAIAGLREAVKLDNAAARVNAIDALRRIGDADAGPIAIARLKDMDAGVRAAAARFLGAHGKRSALPDLREAFKKERLPGTRAAIAAAIKAIGG